MSGLSISQRAAECRLAGAQVYGLTRLRVVVACSIVVRIDVAVAAALPVVSSSTVAIGCCCRCHRPISAAESQHRLRQQYCKKEGIDDWVLWHLLHWQSAAESDDYPLTPLWLQSAAAKAGR